MGYPVIKHGKLGTPLHLAISSFKIIELNGIIFLQHMFDYQSLTGKHFNWGC